MFHKHPVILFLATLLVINLLTAPTRSWAEAPRPEYLNTLAGNAQLELVAQMGGPIEAIVYQPPYIYAGIGPRLVVIDVSTPSQPVSVGQTGVLSGSVCALAVDGSYVFVATDDGKLYTVDVTNPAAPVTLHSFNTVGPLNDIQVVGNYAYAAAGADGLRIIDISSPATLSETGFLDTGENAVALAIAGDYVYILGSNLQIINISAPATPVEIGSFDDIGGMDVEVQGEYLYITNGGLDVLDISNPAVPHEVSSDWIGAAVFDRVAIAGNYAYVASSDSRHGNYCIYVYDISDPSNLENKGLYPTDTSVDSLAIGANYAYVSIGTDFSIVNITNPVGLLTQTGLYHSEFFTPRYVQARNNSLAVTSDKLYFVDITQPITPTEIGSYPLAGDTDATISGNFAYIAKHYVNMVSDSTDLITIDITNPVSPTKTSYTYVIGGPATDLAVSGSQVFMSLERELYTFDVSNPTNIPFPWPSQIGDWPHGANGLAASGKYLYMAAATGLSIVDMTDPCNPVQVGFKPASPCSSYYAVTLHGKYAYVACHEGGMRILDVSNPASPTEVGFYDTLGSAMRIDVLNDYAYIADGDAGVSVVDISDPSHPQAIASDDTVGFSNDVAVFGNYVYVADEGGGLAVLRLAIDKVSQAIPVSGGQLVSSDGNTQLAFPNNALSDSANVTFRQFLYDEKVGELAGIGRIFGVTGIYSETGQTAALEPGRTVTITVHYTDTEIGSAIEDTLGLYSWDGSRWVREINSALDSQNNTMTAAVNHLSLWAVLGETRRLFLPIVYH